MSPDEVNGLVGRFIIVKREPRHWLCFYQVSTDFWSCGSEWIDVEFTSGPAPQVSKIHAIHRPEERTFWERLRAEWRYRKDRVGL
jgi:hypothetical protein